MRSWTSRDTASRRWSIVSSTGDSQGQGATAGQPAGAAQTAQPPQRREPGQPVESPQPGTAGSPASPSSATTDPRAPKRPLPAPTSHTTRHTQDINGEQWTYDATLATLHVETKKVAPASSVFHADFIALPDGAHPDPTRPVTFLFNGGPGSASTFLLLGSLGPRRISWQDPAPDPTAAPTAAPYGLIDNPQSLLPQSDLVFIDAPGAGFSEIAEEAKAELWSVDGDVAAFVQFIQRWLSANGRWNSPKYVFGESYGTVRGSVLSYALLDAGIALNGLVLLSDILDYGHIVGTDDQAYIGYFPTYAAIAHYHGRAGSGASGGFGTSVGSGIPADEGDAGAPGIAGAGPVADLAALRAHVQEAREFADGALRQALSRGDRLARSDAQAVARRYAELAGVSPEYVLRSDLRVLDPRFRKELLRDRGLVVGRYDGRVSGFDLDAASDDETFVSDDAFISPAYGALVNTYLRDELGWTGTQERRAFSEMDWESTEPGKGWVWQHKQPGHTKTMWDQTLTYPQVMPDLASALVRNPRLKVLVANGYFDLATPFFQTKYDIDHLGLPAPLRSNIAFTYYPAGHMVYTSPGCLEKLVGDLRVFYAAGAGAGGAVGTGTATVPVDLSDLDERPELPPLDLG